MMQKRRRRFYFVAGCMLLTLALTGCEKLMRDMYEQPRYKPLSASPLWDNGASARPLQPGTVMHGGGMAAATSSGRLTGEPGTGTTGDINQAATTMATLGRGRERYDIYCAPCHSVTGDGDGMIVRRGFPRPPALYDNRLRDVSDAYLFKVISDGYGAMYPHADRVNIADRRAIVAYIRALQLSQHATLAQIPVRERDNLRAAAK